MCCCTVLPLWEMGILDCKKGLSRESPCCDFFDGSTKSKNLVRGRRILNHRHYILALLMHTEIHVSHFILILPVSILTNSRTNKARESSTCWPQVQSHSWAFTGDVIGEEELSWGQHQAANCYSVGSVAFGKAERNITHVIVKNVFLGILFPLWVGWSVFWDNSNSVPREEQKQVRWSCTFHRCYLHCSSMGEKK